MSDSLHALSNHPQFIIANWSELQRLGTNSNDFLYDFQRSLQVPCIILWVSEWKMKKPTTLTSTGIKNGSASSEASSSSNIFEQILLSYRPNASDCLRLLWAVGSPIDFLSDFVGCFLGLFSEERNMQHIEWIPQSEFIALGSLLTDASK